MFSIVSIISCNIAKRGRDMVVSQRKREIKSAQIESELNLATRIQTSMIPGIFPAFPERGEFTLYAGMDPAKEVGGDFYDFFPIDDDHLCMVIADVSGKGIPAALFMMASKIFISNNAMAGKSPAQILTDTNTAICSNNRVEMFVTVWLGILEISTGKLTAANAGHEYPVIKRPGGEFEIFKDKHSFVVGAMESTNYKEYELTLEPGSKLFLYTDGVPEATDAHGEMFGKERMLAALNRSADSSTEQILKNVRAAVDGFVKEAEQFDDLTMLCFEYNGSDRTEKVISSGELETEAVTGNLEKVIDFVNFHLEKIDCTAKTRMQIDLAVEEIYVNIARYAYAPDTGTAKVCVEVYGEPDAISISFADGGIPYNPLKKDDPDTSLSANEREIGGLGIFLTKKIMDEMKYEYKDGQNILTLKKVF